MSAPKVIADITNTPQKERNGIQEFVFTIWNDDACIGYEGLVMAAAAELSALRARAEKAEAENEKLWGMANRAYRIMDMVCTADENDTDWDADKLYTWMKFYDAFSPGVLLDAPAESERQNEGAS